MSKQKKILLTLGLIVLVIGIFAIPINASDVGNSFSGGGGSSSSGGGGGSLFMFIGGGGIPGLIIMVVIYFVVSYLKNKDNDSNSNTSFDNNYISEDKTIAKLHEIDPEFSAEKFKGFVGEVFLTLQEAWEAREWKKVRAFESNNLFNMHNKQMQEYIDRKVTPHLDGQNVRKVTIANFYEDGDTEVLVVRLNASVIDYDTDDESGKVINGSKTAYHDRSYRLEFIRKKGVKTKSEEGLNVTNCPNCGAPTAVTSSGECEYCGTVITNGEYGWVLNKYAAW